MCVKDLKKLLENIPDDIQIVCYNSNDESDTPITKGAVSSISEYLSCHYFNGDSWFDDDIYDKDKQILVLS